MVRQALLAAGMLLLLGGCGASDGADGAASAARTPAPEASPTPAPGANGPAGAKAPGAKGSAVAEAPVLVFCQRQGEGGARLDTITVRRDGSATLEKRHGGAGGRFKEQVLRRGVLPRLRAALARLPAGSSLTRGSPPPPATQFLLRYRGRTQTARLGGIVPRARPAVELLDGLIDGVGIRWTTRERATHTY